MKKNIFIVIFILTLVYANQAHSVLAVHDEWVDLSEDSEIIFVGEEGVNYDEEMIFDGNKYCGFSEVMKDGSDWKLELELCEERK